MTVFNFCAGPAMLPTAVMERARDELLDWQGLGVSVMEISHRSKEFIALAEQSEANLRQLLGINDDYAVLFLQGGGRGQFAAVPANLTAPGQTTAHILSGAWSRFACEEAAHFHQPRVIAESQEKGNRLTIDASAQSPVLAADQDYAYLHYCANETIEGFEIDWVPEVPVPVVCDMSSNILSRPIDVNKFGLIYAGAQKNIGPSGLAIVIVRKELIGRALPTTPNILNYQLQMAADSMYNTPPTYSWYLAGLVFEYCLEQGGLAALERQNIAKSDMLYQAIDASDFYRNQVDVAYRSRMNVTFQLADPELDKRFLEQSAAAGLLNLKGHRAVGGMRASIYNAMPLAGVQTLVEFMKEFERGI